MRLICKELSVVIGVLGVIGSFICASILGKSTSVSSSLSSYSSKSVEVTRNWGMTIGIFLAQMIGVIVVCVILYSIGEILENIEMLNGRLYGIESAHKKDDKPKNSDKKESIFTSEISKSVPTGSWKCSDCGTVNANYCGTCSCGKGKL
ncbi:hypothetical protein [[Clostridium] fimetarium]|uniref:Uncharacterized protein n=1 Tax=[Clostridium] fimetarium TaxID=99656 RepID=A0A1I0MY80_9FIRM|nr:hypothetical protein [[Clostridium] fimetarium]SEV93399.1 hypothetical protein SAMN05421659_102224 [[Clostridium] fimetarium]